MSMNFCLASLSCSNLHSEIRLKRLFFKSCVLRLLVDCRLQCNGEQQSGISAPRANQCCYSLALILLFVGFIPTNLFGLYLFSIDCVCCACGLRFCWCAAPSDFSLLLVYFVGDPLVSGTMLNDMPVSAPVQSRWLAPHASYIPILPAVAGAAFVGLCSPLIGTRCREYCQNLHRGVS